MIKVKLLHSRRFPGGGGGKLESVLIVHQFCFLLNSIFFFCFRASVFTGYHSGASHLLCHLLHHFFITSCFFEIFILSSCLAAPSPTSFCLSLQVSTSFQVMSKSSPPPSLNSAPAPEPGLLICSVLIPSILVTQIRNLSIFNSSDSGTNSLC